MSNSSLVTYTKISPKKTHPRNDKIRKITIHHMAGNLSVEECGEVFQTREASANYGVNGKEIGLYVDEGDRAWSTSNGDNDHQAVNIELANDQIGGDWHVSDQTISTCILLCVDICKRNGIDKLNYTGDKTGNLTMHKWYASTACPGPYLESKFKYIADEVNKLLKNGLPTDGATDDEKPAAEPSVKPQSEFSGKYPTLPSRGYYLTGDGYDKYTNKKQDIKYIQEFLNWAINANLEIDGCYGPATTKAVEAFQKVANIDVDGSYGKETLSAAKSFSKDENAEEKPSVKPQADVVAEDEPKSYNASYSKTYYVNSKNGVNIRSGAGLDKKVLTAVPNNHKLQCYGYFTDRDGLRWLYVSTEYNGKKYIGFVSSVWVR